MAEKRSGEPTRIDYKLTDEMYREREGKALEVCEWIATNTKLEQFVFSTLESLTGRPCKPGRKKSDAVAKRREEVAKLHERKMQPGEIAAELRIPADTVYKDLQYLRKSEVI